MRDGGAAPTRLRPRLVDADGASAQVDAAPPQARDERSARTLRVDAARAAAAGEGQERLRGGRAGGDSRQWDVACQSMPV